MKQSVPREQHTIGCVGYLRSLQYGFLEQSVSQSVAQLYRTRGVPPEGGDIGGLGSLVGESVRGEG